MSISKDELLKRKEEIVTDYNNLVAEIEKGESQVKTMRNNLSALAGALQQTDLFIKQIEDDGDAMPPEKAFALDMATSQEKRMAELTQEELNGLSPRARKAHGQANDMLQEIVEVNPNADKTVDDETWSKEFKKKKGNKNEKL